MGCPECEANETRQQVATALNQRLRLRVADLEAKLREVKARIVEALKEHSS